MDKRAAKIDFYFSPTPGQNDVERCLGCADCKGFGIWTLCVIANHICIDDKNTRSTDLPNDEHPYVSV